MELRVYAGADGAFTLYDDAGDGYAYERGERATVTVKLERRRPAAGAWRQGRGRSWDWSVSGRSRWCWWTAGDAVEDGEVRRAATAVVF